MSEYIDSEIVEMDECAAEGICLGGGYYPDDAQPLPTNKGYSHENKD